MQERKRTIFITAATILFFVGVAAFAYRVLFSVPDNFPVGKNFTINENESLKSISVRLEDGGYINSALFFRAGISFLGKDKEISLGGYAFPKQQTLPQVMYRFIGKPDFPLLSVTIPEGSTSFQVATLFAGALPALSIHTFGELFTKYEADGKLFPSTYFLLPSYTEEDIVRLMLSTYLKKAGTLAAPQTLPKPLTTEKDVLTLASILEGEANNEEAMKTVAGILLTRMNKGMPLQVDVAMETYKQKGLPFMPLNNPGLTAINAVLHPIQTSYLFYITGNDGKMYYAKTFEEHKKNIKKYLK